MRRKCEHPHERRSPELESVPAYTLDHEWVLVLRTDMDWVPYSSTDNNRGLAAQHNLGRRHLEANTCIEYDITKLTRDSNPFTYKWELPQLIIAHALAEKEERFCVADSLMDNIGLLLHHKRRGYAA